MHFYCNLLLSPTDYSSDASGNYIGLHCCLPRLPSLLIASFAIPTPQAISHWVLGCATYSLFSNLIQVVTLSIVQQFFIKKFLKLYIYSKY